MQPQNQQYLPGPIMPEKNSSLRDILYVLFRRKKAIVLFSGTVFLGVLLFTYISPEIYRSEAKILIRLGRESLALDPTVGGQTVSLSQSRQNEVNSELAIIKSRLLAEQVVDVITPEVFLAGGGNNPGDADTDQNFLRAAASFNRSFWLKMTTPFIEEEEPAVATKKERAVNRLVANLNVAVEQNSHVIMISFESQDPQFSRQVLDSFLTAYQDHHIQVHSSHAPPHFFQEQADNLFAKLQEKENALEKFQATNNITSIDTQKEALFNRISQLQSEISETNSQISASRAHNASLEEALQGRSREIELGRVVGRRSTSIDAIKERLFDFRITEADLAARYPDDHRELRKVREQIKVAEAALGNEKQSDEISSGIDPTYQAMQLDLEKGRALLQSQIARLKALEGDLKYPQEELAALARNELAEARLKRNVGLLEEEYLRFRQDLQRTDISRAMDADKVSNLSIIQPASMHLEPIKPNKALNLSLGFFLAFFGGVTVAFLLEYQDDSLKTKEDVEKRLGLPVLASVPCEESRLCI
ncbi:MAG: GNVR domain-containing protein [Desulfurivibrionaceae bacterium]